MTKTLKAAAQQTPRRSSAPRTPSRGRGVQRFAALLDATDALLTELSPDEVGLYQIAERAGVPPASTYHFFPTKEAAFLALAQRYFESFLELGRRPIDPAALDSWQGLIVWDQQLAVEFYNAHPAVMKILLGRYGGLETRKADIAFNVQLANLLHRRLNTAFHMPFLRDPVKKFHIGLEIVDAVWAISYARHGYIIEDYAEEARNVAISYARSYLPEKSELRDELQRKIALGEAIVLSDQPPLGDAHGDA